jgi:hypothetical protein
MSRIEQRAVSLFCLPFACVVPSNQLIVISPCKALNLNSPRDYSTDTQVAPSPYMITPRVPVDKERCSNLEAKWELTTLHRKI